MKKYIVLYFLVFLGAFNAKSMDNNLKPLVAYGIDGKWTALDEKGDTLFSGVELLDLVGYSEGFFLVKAEINGAKRWAFMKPDGKIAFSIDADGALLFSEGKAVIIKYMDVEGKDRTYGFIDSNGKIVQEPTLYDVISYMNGIAYKMDDNGRGYIDREGAYVIPLYGVVGYQFSEGFAAVSKGDKVGYINRKGDMVIPMIYSEPHVFSEGLVAANKEEDFGYLDTAGNVVIDFKHKDAKDFSQGRAFVGTNLLGMDYVYALINKEGIYLTDYKYNTVREFSEGYASVSIGEQYGFLDLMGNPAFGKDYSFTESFKNGIAWVSKRSKQEYGFIDKTGALVIKVPKADKYIDLRLNKQVF